MRSASHADAGCLVPPDSRHSGIVRRLSVLVRDETKRERKRETTRCWKPVRPQTPRMKPGLRGNAGIDSNRNGKEDRPGDVAFHRRLCAPGAELGCDRSLSASGGGYRRQNAGARYGQLNRIALRRNELRPCGGEPAGAGRQDPEGPSCPVRALQPNRRRGGRRCRRSRDCRCPDCGSKGNR